jgi:predicted GH43/DUF377 family glycosyl hydrolase
VELTVVAHVHPRELFRRHDANPVLIAADFPHMVNAVFNPAAVEFDGETLLLVRVEMRSGLSHLAVATSADGRTNWKPQQTGAERFAVAVRPAHDERRQIAIDIARRPNVG